MFNIQPLALRQTVLGQSIFSFKTTAEWSSNKVKNKSGKYFVWKQKKTF